MRAFLLPLAATVALASVQADSNIDPAHAVVLDELIGSVLWRPGVGEGGASISQYYCSGKIYGQNVGWISLSSGVPANGAFFSNSSGNDYGVNVQPNGDLIGFAYGANIGWINFAANGKPHVNFTTGKLSGSAWGANVGWIELGNAEQYVRIESLPLLPDSDNDGLPDAWELKTAGNLSSLSGVGDADRDGQTDLQEFSSGTDPLDPMDFLIVTLHVSQATNEIQFGTKAGYLYRVEQRAAFGYGSWSGAPIETYVGTGSEALVTVPKTSSNLVFYRVAAYPPLSSVP